MTKPLSPYVLVLRKNKRNNKSTHNNFTYPTTGRVTAPDWQRTKECGNGLHGFPWGQGNSDAMPWLISEDDHGKWLVIKVLRKDMVILTEDNCFTLIDKCKFKTGEVVFYGNRKGAAEFIAADPNCPKSQTAKTIYNNFQHC
jgi:hypothetical protein